MGNVGHAIQTGWMMMTIHILAFKPGNSLTENKINMKTNGSKSKDLGFRLLRRRRLSFAGLVQLPLVTVLRFQLHDFIIVCVSEHLIFSVDIIIIIIIVGVIIVGVMSSLQLAMLLLQEFRDVGSPIGAGVQFLNKTDDKCDNYIKKRK